ncbi:MAG: HEPN domain-containing protein [Bacteroidales bacterium]|nr:HEPN domain-containing protein [Bacteroidales bacterium]
MSLTNDERRAIVTYRIEKADVAVEDVEQLSLLQRWSIAANRLYYAVYYAATALLIDRGYVSHTHSGMITQVNLHFVRQGILSREDGRLIRKLFELRQEADYDDFIDADEADINEYLPQVKILIDKIKSLISD